MNYTDIIDGYQIRDVVYIGLPPTGTPPTYDVVKHVDCDPQEVVSLETGERETITRYCFSVAHIKWDAHERWWQFRSILTRWLEENPPETVVQMILKFCEEKAKELQYGSDD